MKNVLFLLVIFLICGCVKIKESDGLLGPKELTPLERPETTVETTIVENSTKMIYHAWDGVGNTENIGGCQYVRWMYHLAEGTQFEWLHRGDCTNCWTKIKNLIEETHKSQIQVVLPKDTNSNNAVYTNFNKIAVIDGCQYAICYDAAVSYTHVGNCTNCWYRMEELIKKHTRSKK